MGSHGLVTMRSFCWYDFQKYYVPSTRNTVTGGRKKLR